MALQLNRFLINVDQYQKMADIGIIKPSDRVELIEGEIITMSPIKSYHAGIANFFSEELMIQLRGNAIITIQNPLRIDQFSEPEPDILVAKFRADRYRKSHPTPSEVHIAIEVADTSIQYDQEVKLPLYAKAGIPEYWIVNINKQHVEQYANPEGDKYKDKKVMKDKETIKGKMVDSSLEITSLFI